MKVTETNYSDYSCEIVNNHPEQKISSFKYAFCNRYYGVIKQTYDHIDAIPKKRSYNKSAIHFIL